MITSSGWLAWATMRGPRGGVAAAEFPSLQNLQRTGSRNSDEQQAAPDGVSRDWDYCPRSPAGREVSEYRRAARLKRHSTIAQAGSASAHGPSSADPIQGENAAPACIPARRGYAA